METPKLIAIIQYECTKNKIEYVMQKAVEVKKRWNDDILIYKKVVTKTNNRFYVNGNNKPISRHSKDAIRHAMHYIHILIKKELKEKTNDKIN